MHSSTPRRSRSRYLPRIAALLIGLMLLLVLSAAVASVPPLPAFIVFALTLLLCLVVTAAGFIALLGGLYRRNRAAVRNGALAAVIAASPILTVVLLLGPYRLAAPPIHDISTDSVDPPRFVTARSLRSAGENSPDYAGEPVAAAQRRAYPDIKPLYSALSPDAALAATARTARKLGWRIIAVDPAAGRLEATDTTPLFGFTDDIAVRIRPDGAGSHIDIRSASRVGVGDLGANAARVRRFTRVLGDSPRNTP